MCHPIGAKLAQRRILALDTLYHHLFSTPGCDAITIDQLKHDLVLWLTHHSFEELPDALEYYLADPNSDLEGDLAHLTCLDPWGVQVHIHPLVTIYINTLLAWAKCFLATYGVYPGLYDLLDTPRLDFLAAQLHLHDSTLPRPLLHRSRGPPTIRSEYVALQPHLAPSPPPNRLYTCLQKGTTSLLTRFYQCLRLCSCGTKPQRSENHHFVITSSWEPQCHHDIIMRTPRIMGKPKFSCSGGL